MRTALNQLAIKVYVNWKYIYINTERNIINNITINEIKENDKIIIEVSNNKLIIWYKIQI